MFGQRYWGGAFCMCRNEQSAMFSRIRDMQRGRLPFIIGVSGGTASGKSLVTEKIVDRLEATPNHKKRVISIPLESFYRELEPEDLKKVSKNEFDFDHPSAFDFDLLLDALESLSRGKAVDIPRYDFVENNRNGVLHVEPADVIIVEGILIFYDDRIRNMFSMKLFVDADADIRLARRVRRDTVERKRELSAVLKAYTHMVKPAFEEFCQPTKKWADVIIPRGGENDVAIDLLVQHVQDLLRTPRQSPELDANQKKVNSNGFGDHVANVIRPH